MDGSLVRIPLAQYDNTIALSSPEKLAGKETDNNHGETKWASARYLTRDTELVHPRERIPRM